MTQRENPIHSGRAAGPLPRLETDFSFHRRVRHAGIVGNGRTCALVDARGRIGWMCLPTFAQFPLFASLLDPVHGGRLELGIRTPAAVFWSGDYGVLQQRYLPGTNVLETIWTVSGFVVTVRDTMPWGHPALVRDIEIGGVAGDDQPLTLLVRLRPTSPAPADARFTIDADGIECVESRCPARVRLECLGGDAARSLYSMDRSELVYAFSPVANRVTLTLSYGAPPLPDPAIETCAQADAAWLAQAARLSLADRELVDAYTRSLLALRLLCYEPTGAILAAATASWPSEPGGDHNWDYRFCWVRDGCYAAQALDLAGCSSEAERLYRFLLEREAEGQWASPLWAIESAYPTREEHLAGLYGPAGEAPLRIGNAAAQQSQHDSPGNVISGVYTHFRLTGSAQLAREYWPGLSSAAEWCCQHWAELESGIWERRDRQRAWLHGRALAWVALRDAIRLARHLGERIPEDWERTQIEIARAILETGWSEDRGAFLRVCGEPSIYDVSALALLLEDVVPHGDARLRRTVDAIAQHLAYGPAFRRDEEDERYPFYLATLWMIRALSHAGEYDRGYAHLHAVIAATTDLGLMAEYFDPMTGMQYGNFPQAFSHEELVRTTLAMLWRLEDQSLILFPAIPNAWLTDGRVTAASDIPLGATRGSIRLEVTGPLLDFTATGTGDLQLVVPSRYRETGRRVRLNGTWQE